MANEDVVFPPLARSFFSRCFPKIKQSLPLDFAADVITRDFIDQTLACGVASQKHSRMDYFREAKTRKGKTCLIAVPGPSLEERVDGLADLLKQKNRPMAVISVDGASRLFMEKGIVVDLIVTDLDGLTTEDVITLHDRWRSTIVVHGHGNNLQAVKALIERVTLDDRYIFTTQVEPTRHVCNLGGFTDGDRAVFVGLALGFTRLVLVAMDLEAGTIGKYSKPALASSPDDARVMVRHPVKQRKIQVALSILRWLAREAPPGCRIVTFQKRPPFDFLHDITSVEEIDIG
jgi:uncharacterized Rossmann fold enzyme